MAMSICRSCGGSGLIMCLIPGSPFCEICRGTGQTYQPHPVSLFRNIPRPPPLEYFQFERSFWLNHKKDNNIVKLKELKEYSVGEKVRILVDGQRVRGIVYERCDEACSPSPIVRLKVKWRDGQSLKTIERTNESDIVPDGYLFVGEEVQALFNGIWRDGYHLVVQAHQAHANWRSGWYVTAPDCQRYWYPDSDIRLPPTEADRIADATAAKDKIIAEQSAKIADLEKRLATVSTLRDDANKRLGEIRALLSKAS